MGGWLGGQARLLAVRCTEVLEPKTNDGCSLAADILRMGKLRRETNEVPPAPISGRPIGWARICPKRQDMQSSCSPHAWTGQLPVNLPVDFCLSFVLKN